MKKTQKILSAALSAALVLSAMAVPTFANGETEVTPPATTETVGTGESTTTNVANVDGVEYATVEDVNDAIKNSESKTAEIKLLKDATGSIVIPEKTTVTLNLNCKNITVTAGDAIVNKGTLTVKGDGEVST